MSPLNLLHANDRAGQYPDSWYAATADPLAPFAPLQGDVRADVCIVGGGYTGLSAALHLAEAGQRVVLLEAHRVGFGASGRNGGQLGIGQRQDQDKLIRMVGRDDARTLWQMGLAAQDLVKDLIARHQIDCDFVPGLAWAGSRAGDVRDLHDYVGQLRDEYGYTEMEALDADALHAICPSPDYCGGLLDHRAGHLHPLKFAQGLARAAAGAGAQICEQSEVTALQDGATVRVKTGAGSVTADHVILACNGYLGALIGAVASRVRPGT